MGINDRFRKYLVFHEYSFTAKFLRRLLRDKGFKGVIIRSSPPSQGDIYNLFVSSEAAKCIKAMLNAIAQFTEALTFNRLHLGTSLESMAVSGGD